MSTSSRVTRNILAVAFFIVGAFFSIMFVLTLIVEELEGTLLSFSLGLILLVAWYFLKVPTKKAVEFKEEQEALKQKRIEMGVLASSSVHHVEGLPLSEKTRCEVLLTSENLIIEGGGTNFNIAIDQIRAMEVKTDTEIANIVHSSAAKGIVGGLVFGPIGLVVGSRATNKEKETHSYYLIVNYISSAEEIKAIMFDIGESPKSANRIVERIRPLIKDNQPKTITL